MPTTKGSSNVRRTRIGRAIAAMLMVAGIAVAEAATPAAAHDSHGWVWIGDQRIYNYDHRSGSAQLNNVDWPIHIIFWNNATVNLVKLQRQSIFAYNCNDSLGLCNKQLRVDPVRRTAAPAVENTWIWDFDGGRKESRCGLSGGADVWVKHYRAYDNGGQNLWNPYWGYWVPMETHYDYDDPNLLGTNCNNTQHGYNEEAEHNIYFDYLWVPNWTGSQNWMHLHNANAGVRVIDGRVHTGTGTGAISIIHVP